MKHALLTPFIISILLSLATFACRTSSSSDTKSVDDIQTTSRNGKGFSVVCSRPNSSDLYQESYNSASDYQTAVSKNTVCQGNGSGGGGNPDFICKPYTSDTAYVYSLSRNNELGSAVPFKQCLAIIKASKNNFICKPYTSESAYIYNLLSKSEIGSATSIPNCIQLIQDASERFICKPYTADSFYVYLLAARNELGSATNFQNCRQIVSASTGNLTCKPYTSDSFYLYDLSRKSEIGSASTLDNCVTQLGQ